MPKISFFLMIPLILTLCYFDIHVKDSYHILVFKYLEMSSSNDLVFQLISATHSLKSSPKCVYNTYKYTKYVYNTYTKRVHNTICIMCLRPHICLVLFQYLPIMVCSSAWALEDPKGREEAGLVW